MPDLFSIPIFFILFRETIEAAIIVSVMIALIDKISASSPQFKAMSRQLKRQVWVGTLSGLLISLTIGVIFLVILFKYAVDIWAQAEALWEGVFSLLASIMVAVTAISMLKGSRMYERYSIKLAKKLGTISHTDDGITHATYTNVSGSDIVDRTNDIDNSPFKSSSVPTGLDGQKQHVAQMDGALQVIHESTPQEDQVDALRQPLRALFWLPFITMLREGLESVVFIGGVAISEDGRSIPLAVICGILVGVGIGFLLHTGGSRLTLHWFFVISACFLLLIANGLFVKSIGHFEDYTWSKAINLEADDVGTGAFDPRINVWHFDCCSPEDKTQGWGIFNSILGWRNNASVFTVTFYCLFWIISSCLLIFMRFRENKLRANK
ncbi:high-affinity iron permease [Batrachochytrium dendrobatidis]|nr:high-affinity iron permease [Batrachochytrium dendrobatidis]